ncbi:MAG: hypothetical protein ACRYF4_12555 [Janthinobacterium lividum]
MTKRFISASAVFLVALPLLAQGGKGPMEHGPGGPFGGMRSPVTNAPYSASFTDTSSERLQDGSALTHTDTRTVARDSLGRTREETTTPAHGDKAARTEVVIVDPVARTVTQLHTSDKTAVVRTLPVPPQGAATHPNRSADGTTAHSYGPREDSSVVRTDLGSKTISGIVATGTKTTRTIPAGTMGNTAALVSTHEEWFSPDLKIELSRSDSDPFHGIHTLTASGLSKAEPDASLFKVPSDYSVKQAPEHARRRDFGGPHGGEIAPPVNGAASSPGL